MKSQSSDKLTVTDVGLKILSLVPISVETVDLNALVEKALLSAEEEAVLVAAGIDFSGCTLQNGKCRKVVFKTHLAGPIFISSVIEEASVLPLQQVESFVEQTVRDLVGYKCWTVMVDAAPEFLLIANEKNTAFSVKSDCNEDDVLRTKQVFVDAGFDLLSDEETGGQQRFITYGTSLDSRQLASVFSQVLPIWRSQDTLVNVLVS